MDRFGKHHSANILHPHYFIKNMNFLAMYLYPSKKPLN